jgi:hypothetical protein
MTLPALPTFPALSVPTAAKYQQLLDRLEAITPLYAEVPSGFPSDGVTFGSTTLGTVAGMSVPVAANCTYLFEVHLFYTAGFTEGVDLRMLFPSLATLDQGTFTPWNSDSALSGGTHATTEWYAIRNQTSPPAVRDIGGTSTGQPLNGLLKGRLKTGASSGDLVLQAAKHANGPADTVIKYGTYMWARRVA